MSHALRALIVVALGSFPLLLAAAAVQGAAPLGPLARTTSVSPSPPTCGPARDSHARYGWPLKPFAREHPLRGAFGDPRTVERSSQPPVVDSALRGDSGPWSRGSFAFHNGIDIVAADGTPVYAVVSGTAFLKHSHEVSVHASGNRTFQYWHVDPLVRSGQLVVAEKTVVGLVQKRIHHVHLGEIDNMRIVNPLSLGHLGPYDDSTPPTVRALLARTREGATVPLDRLSGFVSLIADAFDPQPEPFPGPWSGKPVAPTFVRWRITQPDGTVARPWATVADFRLTEPAQARFWRVYAPGTYQNFPVLDDHFDFGKPGLYLYRLTKPMMDTTTLANGNYVVSIEASDICGNRTTLAQQITIAN